MSFVQSLCIFNTANSPTTLCILIPLLLPTSSPLCSLQVGPPIMSKASWGQHSLLHQRVRPEITHYNHMCLVHRCSTKISYLLYLPLIINPTQTFCFLLEFPHGCPHMPYPFPLHISVCATLIATYALSMTIRLLNSEVEMKSYKLFNLPSHSKWEFLLQHTCIECFQCWMPTTLKSSHSTDGQLSLLGHFFLLMS